MSRVLIFAERSEAEQLVTLLAVLTGTPEPDWTNHKRRDGSITSGATIPVGATAIEVRIGRPAAPAVIELAIDRDLDEVRALIADTHGCATGGPNDPDAELTWTAAHVGESVTVKVVRAQSPDQTGQP